MTRTRMRRWGRTAAWAALLAGAVGALSLAPGIRGLELRIPDSYFRVAPAPRPASKVVLVLIDDESLRQHGRWPWSRTVVAEMTRKLSEAGAQTIGLDILFAEPQDASADAELARAFAAAGNVVIVDKIGSYDDGPHWTEPLPALAQTAAAVGHAQAVLDRDGVCRRFPPLELSPDGPRWAFAVEVARRVSPPRAEKFLQGYGVPSVETPLMMARPVLAPVAYRRDGFATLSAAAVLRGKGLDVVRGRPVLVGFGTTEISDRLITPLAGELPAPGVEVDAQIVDGILAGRIVHDAPLWVEGLLLLLASGTVMVIGARLRGWRTALGLAGLAAALYAGGLLALLAAGRVVNIGAPLLAVVLGPVLAYTAEFVAVERSVSRQLRELRQWIHARRAESGEEPRDLFWKLELLRELQAELGSAYELYGTLLAAMPDPVAIFDNDGAHLLHNERFAAAWGGSVEKLTLEEFRAQAAPAGENESEVHVRGELYAMQLAPFPATTLSPRGGTIVALASLRARVERDRARAETLGFITHELRTPLVAIQGFAELMQRFPDSPSSAAAPETIFRESKRLIALINSYLDVLRLDAGARPLRSDVVSLDETVRQTFDVLSPLAAANRMQLVFDSSGPAPVIGDEPLLAGAVLNLVSNAIKYGEPGSQVRVSCESSGGAAVLTVENTGDPIPQEAMPRLFEPYFRAGVEQETQSGWGLGLAFVKRIVEQHGGSVVLQSDAGGTCFEVRLPARPRAAVTKGGTCR